MFNLLVQFPTVLIVTKVGKIENSQSARDPLKTKQQSKVIKKTNPFLKFRAR
jgi:hypothetical protein